MLESYRKLGTLLSPREKRSFLVLVGIMLFEALLEMMGVGIVPLYITLLAYPERLLQDPTIREIFGPQWQQWLPEGEVILWGSAIMVLFFVSKTGFTVVAAYWKARFAQNRAYKLSLRLFSAYLNAPYIFHLQQNTAQLLRNVNQEAVPFANRVLSPMVDFISHAVILSAISLLLCFTLPPAVLAWLTAFLAFGIGTATLLQNRGKRLGQEAQTYRSRVIQAVHEGLGGVKEVKLLHRTPYFVQQLASALARILTIQRFMQVTQRTVPSVIELIGVLGLLGVTVMLILDGTQTQQIVTTLTVFAVALTRMKGAVRGLMHTYTEVRHNAASLDVIFEGLQKLENGCSISLTARESNKINKGDCVRLPFRQAITLVDLTYRYPGGHRDTLQGINLDIRRGEAVGFVGTTGAGKSTLMDLILGVLQPSGGSIRVDGSDIWSEAHLDAWQRNLGYVPQAFYLVDGTVSQNIALGIAPDQVNEERLAKAINGAALGGLIERLPDGVETIIGERGVRLSGGERQRIAIARALYNEPEVLVMDEATSALDNTTEAAVIDTVEMLKGERTLLIVAHRLSTVRRCDRIVFLKNGVVDAIGHYDDLRFGHADFRAMCGEG